MLDEEEPYEYSSLVNRWRRERATSALIRMETDFYARFDEHLRALRRDYEEAHADNPTAPKVLILQDELRNLARVREDLYDLRERKVVTGALVAARGGNPDKTNLTHEEEALFDALVRLMLDARRNLLRKGLPAGRPAQKPRPAGPPAPPDEVVATAPAAARASGALAEAAVAPNAPEAPLPGGPPPAVADARPEAESVAARDDDHEVPADRVGPARLLVRLREDVGPFIGTDLREYALEAEDVVALPREIGRALIKRGVAKALGS